MSGSRIHYVAAFGVVIFAFTFATPLFGSIETDAKTANTGPRTAAPVRILSHEPRDVAREPTQAEEVRVAPATSGPEETTRVDVRAKQPPPELPASDPVVPEETPAPVIETEPVEPEEEPEPITETKVEKKPQLPSSDEYEFLALHNEARDQHDLPGLTWSDELADGAANWAATLAEDNCEFRHSDEPYGENLFSLWSNDASVEGTPEDAMDWWVDEEQYYDYEANTCEDGEVCGHYTQIVWEKTTEVGCAITQCTDNKGATDLFVCRYNPPGNIIGKRPY